jgi:putative peptidoglycan lipid II flippase
MDETVRGHKIIRSTLLISFFSVLNFAVTFLTHVILAARFGAKMEIDALFAALTVPTMFIAVSMSVLNIVFVPIFVRYMQEDERESWNIAYNILVLLGLTLSAIVGAGILFSNQIVSAIVPGFGPQKAALTSHLLRIVFPALVLIALADFLSAIHYAYEKFFLPFLSLFLRNLTVVVVVLLFVRVWGIDSYAFGMVFGALLYFALLSQMVFKKGQRRFRWNPGHPGVRKTIGMMAPLLIGGMFFRTTQLVDKYLLSSLPEGSISYLGYSSRVLTVINAVLGKGISLSVYPKMSAYSARKDAENLRKVFSIGFRMMLLAVVPVAFGLIVLRRELIGVLFERGLFDHVATINVSNTLLCHLGAIVALPLTSVVVFAFYSLEDAKTPVKIGIAGALVNIGLDFLLARRFQQLGVAFAFSANTVVNLGIFLYVANRKLRGIDLGKTAVSFFKMSVVSIIMVLGILLWGRFSCAVGLDQQELLSLISSVCLGAGIYIVGTILFRVEEMIFLRDFVLNRARVFTSRGS